VSNVREMLYNAYIKVVYGNGIYVDKDKCCQECGIMFQDEDEVEIGICKSCCSSKE